MHGSGSGLDGPFGRAWRHSRGGRYRSTGSNMTGSIRTTDLLRAREDWIGRASDGGTRGARRAGPRLSPIFLVHRGDAANESPAVPRS